MESIVEFCVVLVVVTVLICGGLFLKHVAYKKETERTFLVGYIAERSNGGFSYGDIQVLLTDKKGAKLNSQALETFRNTIMKNNEAFKVVIITFIKELE